MLDKHAELMIYFYINIKTSAVSGNTACQPSARGTNLTSDIKLVPLEIN